MILQVLLVLSRYYRYCRYPISTNSTTQVLHGDGGGEAICRGPGEAQGIFPYGGNREIISARYEAHCTLKVVTAGLMDIYQRILGLKFTRIEGGEVWILNSFQIL